MAKQNINSLRLGKKAGVYFFIFQMIIIVLIGSAITLYINKQTESTTSEKIFFSRDIAFEINSVYSSPGNFFETYTLPIRYHLFKNPDFYYFNFDFNSRFVDVNKKRFPYAENSYLSLDSPASKNLSELYFENYGSEFRIGQYKEDKIRKKRFNQRKINIPVIQTTDISWSKKTIVIKPENSNFVKLFYGIYSKQLNLSYSGNDASAVIELHFDNSSNIIAEIPYSSLKSRKLASILINNLLELKKSDINRTIGNAYINIIDNSQDSEPFVILRIGKNLNYNSIILAKNIFKSLEEYFK